MVKKFNRNVSVNKNTLIMSLMACISFHCVSRNSLKLSSPSLHPISDSLIPVWGQAPLCWRSTRGQTKPTFVAQTKPLGQRLTAVQNRSRRSWPACGPHVGRVVSRLKAVPVAHVFFLARRPRVRQALWSQ